MYRGVPHRTGALAGILSLLFASACGGEGLPHESVDDAAQALEAVCVEPDEAPPSDAWLCGESQIVECQGQGRTAGGKIHVALPPGPGCGEGHLELNDRGPFAAGIHGVEVEQVVGLVKGPEVTHRCSSLLTVMDTKAPRVTPFDHRLVADGEAQVVTPWDCADIEDACDSDVRAIFTDVRSDEPVEDLQLGCDEVVLPAVHDGGDGRVYTLGVLAIDAWGNETKTECRVSVAAEGSEAVAGAAVFELRHEGACGEPS